jgi:hypothetical protein
MVPVNQHNSSDPWCRCIATVSVQVLERLSQLVRYEKDLCTPVTLSNPSVHRFSNGTLYLPRGTCLRAVDYLVGILRPHVLTSTCDIKGQLQEMGVTATSLASAEASMYW